MPHQPAIDGSARLAYFRSLGICGRLDCRCSTGRPCDLDRKGPKPRSKSPRTARRRLELSGELDMATRATPRIALAGATTILSVDEG
jgi:hypothetical protein